MTTRVAVGAVGVFLTWAAVRIHDIVDIIYQNSDNAAPLVLAQSLDDRGSGDVVLGNSYWLEPLFALHLTRWLPSHEVVWKAGPFAAYAVAVALIGWAVARSVSRRAGLLVSLAMAAPAPIVVIIVIGSPDAHVDALLHVAILAAFLVSSPGLVRWGKARRGLWALGLAVTLAPGIQTDPLLIAGGVVPFLVAVAVGWRLSLLGRASAALAAGACLAGAAAGRAISISAEHHGIRSSGVTFPFASPEKAIANVRLLAEDIALFAQGRLSGDPHGVDVLLEVAALCAIVTAPILLIVAAAKARGVLSDQNRSVEQRLLGVYWGMGIAAIAAAFIASTAPVDITSVRYVTMLWPALLTLAVILFRRRALIPIATLATLTAILGCIQLARGSYTVASAVAPHGGEVDRLQRFVLANDLNHGYAGYWDAATITVQTHFAVPVYPVNDCGAAGDGRCPFFLARLDSWYRPRDGIRTFYVVDDRGTPPAVGPPPRRWGRPARKARIGLLRVYTYNFDLASILERGTAPQRADRPQA